MMEPNPPPRWIWRTSSRMASRSFASPPEKMTMRRPAKVHCTTCFTRSASDSIGTGCFS